MNTRFPFFLLVLRCTVRFRSTFLLGVRFRKSVHKSNGRYMSFCTAHCFVIRDDLKNVFQWFDGEFDALSRGTSTDVQNLLSTKIQAIDQTPIDSPFALCTLTLRIFIYALRIEPVILVVPTSGCCIRGPLMCLLWLAKRDKRSIGASALSHLKKMTQRCFNHPDKSIG